MGNCWTSFGDGCRGGEKDDVDQDGGKYSNDQDERIVFGIYAECGGREKDDVVDQDGGKDSDNQDERIVNGIHAERGSREKDDVVDQDGGNNSNDQDEGIYNCIHAERLYDDDQAKLIKNEQFTVSFKIVKKVLKIQQSSKEFVCDDNQEVTEKDQATRISTSMVVGESNLLQNDGQQNIMADDKMVAAFEIPEDNTSLLEITEKGEDVRTSTPMVMGKNNLLHNYGEQNIMEDDKVMVSFEIPDDNTSLQEINEKDQSTPMITVRNDFLENKEQHIMEDDKVIAASEISEDNTSIRKTVDKFMENARLFLSSPTREKISLLEKFRNEL